MNIRTLPKRVALHLADPRSRYRQIAIGFAWVSLFSLVGKVAGAAKEMAIAWRYGISETVDAYVFMFNVVNWPITVWFSVLSVVLVPLFARVGYENPATLSRFRAELFGFSLLFGAIIGALLYFGFPIVLRAGWTGLTADTLKQALSWIGFFSLLVPLGFMISLLSAWMLASNRHRNTLFEAIPALMLLTVLVLPSSLIPEPLVWGTVAGFALHVVALALSLQKRGELPIPRLSFRSPAWTGFWSSIGILAAAQALMSFTSIIDQLFAADLGPGAISTLSYTNRVLALLLGLGGMAVSRATLPVFSEIHIKGSIGLQRLATRWMKVMFMLGVVVCIIGWVLSPLVIRILFERGAFSPEDTMAVVNALRYGLMQVPFYFAGIVAYSLFSGRGQYKNGFFAAIICVPIKILCNYVFSPLLGVAGIQLATAFMYLSFSAALFFLGHRKNGGLGSEAR